MQMAHQPIVIEVASRTYPTEIVSGDAWHVSWTATGCRIAVIDGLGHGPGAEEAAVRAQHALELAPEAEPIVALRACHDALRGSRGAAVGIAAIDLVSMRLSYAGVGNIEGVLSAPKRTARLISMRGIIGARLPTLRAFSESLDPEWMLLLYTDGVRDRFSVADVIEANARNPRAIADSILTDWGRHTDDATILVAAPTKAAIPSDGDCGSGRA